MFDKSDPRLTAYLLGELDEAEAKLVSEALQSNPELQAELQQLQAVISQVQHVFQSELQTTPLRDHVSISDPPSNIKAASLRNRRRIHWQPWVLVATVLLSLGAIGYWLTTPPNIDRMGGAVIISQIQDPELLESQNRYPDRLAKIDGMSRPSLENRSRIDSDAYVFRPDARRGGEPTTDEFDALKDLIHEKVEPESFLERPRIRGGRSIRNEELPPSSNRRRYQILPSIDKESLPELFDLLNNEWDESTVEQQPDSSSVQIGKSKLRVSVDPTIDGAIIGNMSEEELRRFQTLVDSLNSEPALDGKLNEQSSAETETPRTWRRVNATPNTTRLMVGQDDELKLNGTQVHIHVDGFRARVVMDTFYYNDRPQALEGTFKLRLPDDASLFYLAFGDSVHDFSKDPNNEKELLQAMQTQYVSLEPNAIGTARTGTWQNVKEARVVTREKAAYAYNETVRRQVDPALAEWAGAGVFQARVFPLQPHRMHRIVVGYDVNLQHSANGLGLRFDLPSDAGFTQVEMSLDATAADSIQVTPKCVPVTRNERSVYFWSKPEGNAIELIRSDASPRLLVSPTPAPAASPSESKPYFAAQLSPELPKSAATTSRRAIFMLDTSLSSNPDKFNVWLKLLEQTLTQNQDSIDSFAVLMFSVDQHYWREQFSPNTPEQVQQLCNDCQQIVLEGATDLFAAARKLNQTAWLQDGGATPDVFLLSDGAATWGESSAPMIRAEFANANIGGLFAYQTGMSGTEVQTLRYLANSFGGAVFSVANESELALAATAHRSRPWQVVSLRFPGTTDLLTAGRVEWLYPGQALMLAGRGEPNGPLTMELQQDDSRHTVQIEFGSEQTCVSELVSRLYGQIAVTQLESLGALNSEVAAAYARHYRVAGETCSLVMLESEADYQRFNIRPEDDWLMIQTQAVGSLIERSIEQGRELLLDPKVRFVQWLRQLESAPGLGFQIPPALKLALDQIQVPVVAAALETKSHTVAGVSEEYLAALLKEEVDYDRIHAEADRRANIGRDDAVKVWSNLIERHPTDAEVLRDVAWSLMELDRADHAFGLLQRVARLRPYEGAIYLAIANALQQARQADLALVYYEIALNAKFDRAGEDFPRITANDYEQLLQSIVAGEIPSSLKDYASARLESLRRDFPDRPELAVTMFWNTDRTDVDLHVTEPTEEVCFYQRRQTRIGGQMTTDITTGFGPEMYSVAKAPAGGYQIDAHYYRNDQNRTKVACRVFVTVVQRQDSGKLSRSVHVVRLNNKDEKQTIAKINR